jgi:hypothetical protein
LAVFASHQFNDVPNSHTFHNAIAWMKDNNITVGCNPPGNTNYCPDDNVTRGQMSAFMKRLAENNVVDAATLDGLDSTVFLQADPVVTSQPSDNWVANSGVPPTSVQYFITRTRVSGDGFVEMALNAPMSIGTATYGLTNVRLCLGSPVVAAFVTSMAVYRLSSSGGTSVPFADGTDRSEPGCYDYPVDLAIGAGLSVIIQVSGGAGVTMDVGSLVLTWQEGAGLNSLDVAEVTDDPLLGN